jgi:hypothetical protein
MHGKLTALQMIIAIAEQFNQDKENQNV